HPRYGACFLNAFPPTSSRPPPNLFHAAKNCSDASIVAELEKQEIELQSYRRETGLAAAYYLLAGRRLKSKHHIEGARGRRKGRRR
ncbi:MAG: hypothetical protein AAGA30_19790, partial [Planctomycetota bacterium]